MKTIRRTLLLFAIFIINIANAQEPGNPICTGNDILPPPVYVEKNINCSATSFAFTTNWNNLNYDYYEPKYHQAIKTVLVNFVVIQDDYGQNNYQNNQATIDFFNATVNDLNAVYRLVDTLIANPIHPDYHPPYISDTRIQFELANVYFLQNSALHSATVTSGSSMMSFLESENPLGWEDGINIFFTEGVYSYEPTAEGIANLPTNNWDYDNYIITFRKHSRNYQFWTLSRHLAHELGHNLGLRHPYDSEVCDTSNPEYLSDLLNDSINYNCTPSSGCDVCYHEGGYLCHPLDPTTRCTNNLMGGGNHGHYHTTPKQMGVMHRALSIKNSQKYVKDDSYTPEPWYIDGNQNWDFRMRFYNDLVVSNGSTLTISCLLEMIPNSKIRIGSGSTIIVNGELYLKESNQLIVESGAELIVNNIVDMGNDGFITVKPGGKVTVNGGIITNSCGESWKGIYVEGNRNLSQTFANQGAVILQNGAIIENAVSAINLHSYDEMWWTNGGIVQATNSTFRNNKRDIAFVAYQNKDSSGAEINNISFLTGCTFTMDDNSLFDNPNQNVTLWSVKGVVFNNCDFSDTRTQLIYGGSEANTRDGIYAYTATFKALGSEFTNLKYGIYNTTVGASHTFTAGNCEFDCFRGLYNNSAVNPAIYSNQFTVKPGYMFNDDMGSCSDTYGLYVENSLNFNIHDNILTSSGTQAPYCNSFGIIINNSGSTYKNLYRNTFSGFYNGIQASGNNKGVNKVDGLEIRCNTFTSGHYLDIYVTGKGIRYYQGLQRIPTNNELAGNLFSSNTYFINAGDPIRYYHHKPASYPNILPDHYNANTITFIQPGGGNGIDFDPITSCPITVPDRSLQMLVTDINDAREQYNETDLLLQSYVDDGNTELMTQQVEMAGDYDAWQTYQYLMQTSPYLSEEVLSTLSEREDGFNQAMIRDVLVENPQAAKSQEVTEALDNRINQLPAYMRWQIRNGLYQFGQKEIMELHKAAQKIRFDEAVNEMIFHKMEGTEGWENTPSLSELLADVDDVSFQFLRSEFAFDENGYDAAVATLNQIANDYTFSDAADQQKWNDYMQFYSVMNSLAQASDTLADAQIQQLMTLTEASPRIAGKAIAFLTHHKHMDYQEPIYYPEEEMELKSGAVDIPTEPIIIEETTTDEFTIFPNPALDYITLSWCSDAAHSTNMSVEIFDSRGVLVHTEPLTSNCDQMIFQVTNWQRGTYTATIKGSSTRSITFVVGR